LTRDTRAILPPVAMGPWRLDALCRGMPLEWFFPPKGQDHKNGRAVCGRCPVTAQCLAWALETGQEDGLWGGLTTPEREKLIGRARGSRKRVTVLA